MIRLYSNPSGAWDFELLGKPLGSDQWGKLRDVVRALLNAEKKVKAARLVNSMELELHRATNGFGDDFYVLHARVPTKRYTAIARLDKKDGIPKAFEDIAKAYQKAGYYVRHIAVEPDLSGVMDGISLVTSPQPRVTSQQVARALDEAEQLLRTNGASSAVDRGHTALHAYLRGICSEAGVTVADDEAITGLLKALRKQTSLFELGDGQHPPIERIRNGLATIIDAFQPVRNSDSMAHPTDELLQEAEAVLVLNSIRTLLHYIDARVRITWPVVGQKKADPDPLGILSDGPRPT